MNETPEYFQLIKVYYLNQFTIFSDKYPPTVNINILPTPILKDNEVLNNYGLKITIDNQKTKRQLVLNYREGPNAAKTISNHIVFEIKNTLKNSKHSRNNFFIGDFCEFYDIELSEPSFYETTGENYSLEKFKKYIDAVKSIIENTNLKDILEGKIWIDIPINMKPYK